MSKKSPDNSALELTEEREGLFVAEKIYEGGEDFFSANAAAAYDTSDNSPAEDEGLLPVGTRIRFLKTLDAPADDHSPDRVYAYKGELGEITGHGTREGYWAKTDSWPHPFGASRGEFDVLDDSAEMQ